MGYASPRIGFGKYFVEFSVFDAVRKAFPAAEYVGMTTSCYKVRSIKDASEIGLMRKAAGIVVQGMRAAIDAVEPGRKEVEVAAEAEYAMGKAGSQGSPFRMQVLVHERQLLTHPFAGESIDSEQPARSHSPRSHIRGLRRQDVPYRCCGPAQARDRADIPGARQRAACRH